LTLLAWSGIGMLVLAVVIILIGGALSIPRALRVRRVMRETTALVLTYRLVIGISTLELRLAALERNELLRPYRRLRRWVTHPLTLAVLESWRRRRKRVREARLEAMGSQ